MTRRVRRGLRRAALAASVGLLAGPAAAHAEVTSVDMYGTAFRPNAVTIVAGDTVVWRNGDLMPHDVKATTFTSGIVARFDSFTQRFDAPGPQPYVCSLHPFMTGQVDVLAATLTGPAEAVIAGEAVELKGRTAAGSAVTLEREGAGGIWVPAGAAKLSGDGTFKGTVKPGATANYRARTAAGESAAVAITVSARPKVKLTAAGRKLRATTTPARPGLLARFEAYTPKRKQWTTFASATLDAGGRASARPRRMLSGKVRVVLSRDPRGPALATSKTLRLG